MSYAFDTLVQVWQKRVDPLIEDRDLAMLFGMLFEEMHSANHVVQYPGSQVKGDGVNQALGVVKSARRLEEYENGAAGMPVLSITTMCERMERAEAGVEDLKARLVEYETLRAVSAKFNVPIVTAVQSPGRREHRD